MFLLHFVVGIIELKGIYTFHHSIIIYEPRFLQSIHDNKYTPLDRPRSSNIYITDKPLALWAWGLSVVNLDLGHILIHLVAVVYMLHI